MDNEKSIEVLNALIKINNDRIAGYEAALTETEEEDLKVMFAQFAETSKKCKAELTAEVKKMDGIPTTDTKAIGTVFRAWMSIKTVLTAHHSKSILNSCELGEEEAVKAYDNALTNRADDISEEQQVIINAQYTLIKAEQQQIISKRDLLPQHN